MILAQLAWLLAVPLLGILTLPLLSKCRLAYTLLNAGLVLASAILLMGAPLADTPMQILGPFWLMLDRYSWMFLLTIHAVWFLTILYTHDFTAHQFAEESNTFYLLLNLSFIGLILGGLASDFLTFVLTYGFLGSLSYGLIRFRRSAEAYKANRVYLVSISAAFLLAVPSIGYFASHQWVLGTELPTIDTWIQAPRLTSLALAALVLGLGSNVVFPFHRWLPRTMVTPAPATVLLHTAGTVNLGTLMVLKVGVYVIGSETLHLMAHHWNLTGWLTYLLGFNALIAAWMALRTPNLKERFSYSTISQISYILTAFLIGTPLAMLGGMLHMVTHALAKTCLFFVAGYFNVRDGSILATELAPILPHRKPIAIVVALCGLSIIGFPYLAGFISKDLILVAEWKDHDYAAAVILVIGSLINVLYIYPVIRGAFRKTDRAATLIQMPSMMSLAIGLAVLCLVLFQFFAAGLVAKYDPGLVPAIEALGEVL